MYEFTPPFNSGYLKVTDLHEIYYEEMGNPTGKPIVYIHGGPGAGCEKTIVPLYDLTKYRLIAFDQRGCGRSKPHAELKDNTTQDLVADMELLREHLGIEKWLLHGGSWGSTLALVYAEMHPERVSEMVLRGIFMCRRSELEFFYQEGSSWLYPDAFAPYLAHIPATEQHDLLTAYNKRLTANDPAIRLHAARAWSDWEMATSKLFPKFVDSYDDDYDQFAMAFARIENHYFVNGIFLEDGWILKNVDKIRHIPCVIVHGRYDMVCPLQSAWDLHQAWPESELIITHAGHASSEQENTEAQLTALDRFAG